MASVAPFGSFIRSIVGEAFAVSALGDYIFRVVDIVRGDVLATFFCRPSNLEGDRELAFGRGLSLHDGYERQVGRRDRGSMFRAPLLAEGWGLIRTSVFEFGVKLVGVDYGWWSHSLFLFSRSSNWGGFCRWHLPGARRDKCSLWERGFCSLCH